MSAAVKHTREALNRVTSIIIVVTESSYDCTGKEQSKQTFPIDLIYVLPVMFSSVFVHRLNNIQTILGSALHKSS